ncbi:hypothetical protein M0R89_19390 (plasmid) [Halorussus limi]|uniref:Uncharacterized protein n=1 Tax=Halorussus limi TaxID=2938695 RepID=A0A8U0HZK7_9EURY|nr:hypothetical protein [Halorussus limi]UPV76329.1 hypothetical protein M0R89_19390 [Halorussus limi]
MGIGRAHHGERETVFDWLAALLAVVLAGIHIYLGAVGDEQRFFVVAGFFVVGVLFFFTGYWRAMVYLLAAVYVATLGVLWLLGGMQYREVGLLTGAVSLLFIGLVVYLFYEESGQSE